MKPPRLDGAWPLAGIIVILLLAALDTIIPGLARFGVMRWLALAIWLLVLVSMIRHRREPGSWPTSRGFLIWSFSIVMLIGAYLLNPTHRAVSGVGLLPVAHVAFLPGTVHYEETAATLWFMVTALAVSGCAMLLTPRTASWLLHVLLVMGSVIVVMAILQRLAPRAYPVYERTGVFVSENHFAAFANLVFPLALAAAARAHYHAFTNGRVSSPSPLFIVAAGLIACSIWLARSRAGVAITVLITLAFIVQQVVLARRYPFITAPRGAVSRLAGVAALVVAMTVVAFQLGREWRSVRQFGSEISYRGQIIADSLSMWRDRFAWGVGPGAYASAFPYYQSPSIQDRFIRHAHAEPVEMIAEYGIAGVGILALAAWPLLSAARRRPPASTGTPLFQDLESPAVALGIAGCLIHGLVDFPLRTPLVGLMMSAYAGVVIVLWPRGWNGWIKLLRSRDDE